ncbi:MAG: type II toxin-antitoxin system VapC family toxin [Candidatus Bipolaricaulota bacterium]|nr:type II toxin-antitoxin system VapC family toxin [Candidatus Bipolaricaulota bacterium]
MPPEKEAFPLTELSAGQTVFIDANIFIYHFTGLSQECSIFLERCERGEVWGVTAVHILLEVLHRLMMIEAVTKELVTSGNIAKKLRKRPNVVKQLADYQTQTEAILEMGIEVVGLTSDSLKVSHPYRQQDGLLVNDSQTAAVMEAEGILYLATADPDFTRVEELRVYSPLDLAER